MLRVDAFLSMLQVSVTRSEDPEGVYSQIGKAKNISSTPMHRRFGILATSQV